MKIRDILCKEYLNRFSSRKMLLLHALLYYYRDPNFRVVVLGRIYMQTQSIFLQKKCRKKLVIKYNVTIAKNCKIGINFFPQHYDGIVIGDATVIGSNCTIYQQVTLGQKDGKFPVIGDNVTIYAGAKVLGDIQIGNNCIIGANAVVLKSFSDDSVIAGVPAKVVGKVKHNL